MAANCRALIEAVSIGDSDAATTAADALADAFEATPEAQAARLIRARDPLAITRAVEIAERLLSSLTV
ncbi:MAG: hypothetical protein ABI183_10880, partial [Polyangiaceae bacterium]